MPIDTQWQPSYVAMARSGTLAERADRLEQLLSDCTLCPRECRVDRHSELGTCSTGAAPVVASHNPHFGEEPPISGRRGSGTVFLANCNLSCVFCQNHDISQRPRDFAARAGTGHDLARMFLDLRQYGCHNINWVSPTHQVPQLVRALDDAAAEGLDIPIVYNTNGYDSVEVLQLLDGVVDIYMPDLKYADAATGERLSGVPDYPQRARAALAEMHRQVGDTWQLGRDGELQRGLLVRLLVLPDGLAGIDDNLRWIARNLSPRVTISLLAQYRPANRVTGSRHLELQRGISSEEWTSAVTSLRTHMHGRHHHVQGSVRLLL
jgi:putative pyruvate formate lyase activating enzyme